MHLFLNLSLTEQLLHASSTLGAFQMLSQEIFVTPNSSRSWGFLSYTAVPKSIISSLEGDSGLRVGLPASIPQPAGASRGAHAFWAACEPWSKAETPQPGLQVLSNDQLLMATTKTTMMMMVMIMMTMMVMVMMSVIGSCSSPHGCPPERRRTCLYLETRLKQTRHVLVPFPGSLIYFLILVLR